MSRIPPGLLYLTIYNPTLRPPPTLEPHDEDAQEQAHILFYTARERAVSRDRILRQVGLAKALVNFSEMFSEGVCDNVHSQTRRMVMVSPEPDYWIHACFEVAKTPRAPRPPSTKGKAKAKEKERSQEPSKGKGKEPETVYDYHDSSLHDLALRTHLLRGYELFKVKHGSFTHIIDTLGQPALESYLERFFTVWAWKWDIEDDSEFGDHLGVPLHPLFKSLTPILDTFSSDIPSSVAALLLVPPHVVPSTRFTSFALPSSLARHLLSIVSHPHRPPTSRKSSKQALQALSTVASSSKPSPAPRSTLTPLQDDPILTKNGTIKASAGHQRSGSLFTMSNMNMSVNMDLSSMDVRKWSWPGYLSFGKGSGSKPVANGEASSKVGDNDVAQEKVDTVGKTESSKGENGPATAKDSAGVVDGASSEDSPPVGRPTIEVTEPQPSQEDRPTTAPVTMDSPVGDPPSAPPILPSTEETSAPSVEMDPTTVVVQSLGLAPSISTSTAASETSSLAPSTVSAIPTPASSQLDLSEPPPEFSVTTVHVAIGDDRLQTKRRRVLYLTKHRLSLALLCGDEHDSEELDLQSLAEKSVAVLQEIRQAIKDDDEEKRTGVNDPLPSVANILQPKNRHVISTGPWTVASEGFNSKSEHLYSGHQLLQRESDVLEIFSRGQQPQHWHISKRGLGADKEGNPVGDSVFMEVLRKEDSLIDVDNELAGVARRFTST
ncbi:hypothetical protein GLOTRDRAFT_138110 [Gloeophyllum trabeum ATCC 11539]|uniref:CCZ1/INTU/HSP4 first Longin domain-containing protein n=1 Tax=Gloeophyllum trabeum (strain ATCC 11539 / FP-39264 / Madison 617) TaxID=670483 RepID=S7RP92_GLOTA|nr:uncharacterized protein GLOTRDRAFT_138110 [Gloeophyllum trabeum ATCC 11539]EPQ56355.1 hypothetical protein GLOTRDRAFT_138110 [Gloeophyllum trabeum ATCC 11539]